MLNDFAPRLQGLLVDANWVRLRVNDIVVSVLEDPALRPRQLLGLVPLRLMGLSRQWRVTNETVRNSPCDGARVLLLRHGLVAPRQRRSDFGQPHVCCMKTTHYRTITALAVMNTTSLPLVR